MASHTRHLSSSIAVTAAEQPLMGAAYEKMDPDTVAKCREADNLRKFAFIGVALSTVATLVCVISVPMVYNYMQHVQSVLQNEVDFCKVPPPSANSWQFVLITGAVTVSIGQFMVGSDAYANDERHQQALQATGGTERL